MRQHDTSSDSETKGRRDQAEVGSFYFIFWGIIVSVTNLLQFILGVLFDYPYPYVVWLAIIPAALFSGVYAIRRRKSHKPTHASSNIHKDNWLFIFSGMLLIILFGEKVNHQISPLITLLLSIGTFTSGRAMGFRPLQLGGLSLFLASMIMFLVPRPYQPLIASIGMILGNFVPGLQLRAMTK
ncbi:MAG: hypothetical protein AAGA85_20705 [Bacteroidota bacterium]